MNHKGFTLIELVMIIVLLGILAVFAAPRLGNLTTSNSGAFVDKLKADIRYAQSLAMTQNRRYRVYVNTAPYSPASGYAVVYDTSGGAWTPFAYASDPATGDNLSVTLNAGSFFGITVAGPAFVEFNSLGRPTAGATITVNPVGRTITITAETGAVN